MPDVVVCHNAQGLRTPGRGVAVSEHLGQWEEDGLQVVKCSECTKQARIFPPAGQGHFSNKSRLCMFFAFPSSRSSLILSLFSPLPSERAT